MNNYRKQMLLAFADSDFKRKFLSLGPGKEREDLIYQAAISRPLPKLVPIKVKDPSGIIVKYDVMPDYLTIDGIRVPLSPITAQRIANHFGMTLPTAKMSKQIWQAADGKVTPTPMSAGATIGGKFYTGQQVVDSKIGTSDTSEAFSQKVDDQIRKEYQDKSPTLIAGHMKDITLPDTGNKERTHAVGWYSKDGKPIQGGNGITMHDLHHAEYASGTRLIGNKFTFTLPNGKTVGPLTIEELQSNPEFKDLAKTISNNPAALSKYDTHSSDKAKASKVINPTIEKKPELQSKPIAKTEKTNKSFSSDEIDKLLSELQRFV